MAVTVPDILARIVAKKREEVAAKRPHESALTERAYVMKHGRRDFLAALEAKPPSIIAEIKKASPSKGLLSEEFDPEEQASAYQRGGAAALSVLTDAEFFQGHLKDLRSARARTGLPVLRKDFTIDELDVIEAAAHEADAILLIASILSRNELERLRKLAEAWNLTALVEVHEDSELDRALESGARLVGVNNRNLHTFEVSLETSERLARSIPVDVVKVAESGIHSRADVARLTAYGFQAFLVGEHLMKSGNAEEALRDLIA